MPWMLMSSSISGQCTPVPSPMISKCCRCCTVASRRRQDHVKGTVMRRPSTSTATISLSVTSIVPIRGSVVAAMCIPSLHDSISMAAHQFLDRAQFDRVEAAIIRQRKWIEPELAHAAFTPDMNMRTLRTVEAVEKQSVGAEVASDRRHGSYICVDSSALRGSHCLDDLLCLQANRGHAHQQVDEAARHRRSGVPSWELQFRTPGRRRDRASGPSP